MPSVKRSPQTELGVKRPVDAPGPGNRYRVAVADRVLDLLDLFLTASGPHTLASLAAAAGIPRPTAFRMLSTLEEHGLVAKSETGEYLLGYKCLMLGCVVENDLELRTEALPVMESLRDRTGETVQVAVLENWQVVYLERVLSRQPVAYMTSRAGSILPAYCTGLGKCLLAYEPVEKVAQWADTVSFPRLTTNTITSADELLEELVAVRSRGYSIDNQERQPGVACVAAPIRDARGRVVAGISAAGPASRLPRLLIDSELAEQVRQAADAVSMRLGRHPGNQASP